MPKRMLDSDASVVLRDFTAELGAHAYVYDDSEIAGAREQPGLFQARNAALLALARYVGELRMYRGASWAFKNGDATSSYYLSENHLVSLIETRAVRSLAMARLACATCPLAGVCGTGPDELIKEIKLKSDRRRFVARLRRAPNNTHLCETNLQPPRLKKDIV